MKQPGSGFGTRPDNERTDGFTQKSFHDAVEVEGREMGNPGQRFQVNFFSEVQIYIIHYCVHTLLVFLLGCLFLLHGSIGLFHVAKIGGKEIGYLSDVAINAISLNKISYIPAQLFRASMKVLHSICNIFAFQMKKQMLADDRGD
jgi:hypothetical protein